jgi:type I restriction enzyme S subunit
MDSSVDDVAFPTALPDLPSDWEYARLGELVEDRGICYGIVQPGVVSSQGTPVLRVNNIRNGRIDAADVLRVDPAVEAKFQRSRLCGGEVLLTLVGTLGEIAIVPAAMSGWNVARAVGVVPVRKDIGSRWVAICLRSALCQHCIRSWATTTVQATFNLRDVANLPIPLPPTQIREAIAQILGTLDDKIELNRRMNATLESISRAIFKSWFVDFDPVRQKAAGQQPVGMDAQTAAMFPDSFEDSEIGEVPKGWTVTVLEEVLEEIETGSRPKGGVSGYSAGVPSIGAESIVGLGIFDYSKTKFVPHDFYAAMTRGRIRSRDVLLYKDGGRPGEFEPHITLFGDGFPFAECAINEHVYRLRARTDYSQNLLYFWLSSDLVMDEMRVKGTGVAIPGLNSTQAKSLTTLRPPLDVAAAFNQRVEPAVAKILAACNESRTLATLRDTLLPKVLSGEIRVPEAEQAVEEAIA